MLRFATTDSAPIAIQVTLTAPRVYLDHSVVSDFAVRNAELGRQFREDLERADGTLLLSWAHVIELFALGDGPTFKQIAAYLTTFGGRFAIIDADPSAVTLESVIET